MNEMPERFKALSNFFYFQDGSSRFTWIIGKVVEADVISAVEGEFQILGLYVDEYGGDIPPPKYLTNVVYLVELVLGALMEVPAEHVFAGFVSLHNTSFAVFIIPPNVEPSGKTILLCPEAMFKSDEESSGLIIPVDAEDQLLGGVKIEGRIYALFAKTGE
jgi:hypothetical protein